MCSSDLRFFRDLHKFPSDSVTIPLELNCYNGDTKSFLVIDKFSWAEKVQLRTFYFNKSNELSIGRYNSFQKKTIEETKLELHEIVETFFDNVLANVLGV